MESVSVYSLDSSSFVFLGGIIGLTGIVGIKGLPGLPGPGNHYNLNFEINFHFQTELTAPVS
jgi:hypothetical protein